MARSVTFNGQTRFKPGGITRINADSLTPITGSTNGIVALIGEADGGPDGEIVVIDDPTTGIETFRSGPLADAIKIAFNPSADPRIPGGAFRVLAYKTNAGTQSSTGLNSTSSSRIIGTCTAAAGSTTTATWTSAILPTSGTGLKGYWLRLTKTGGTTELRRILSNTSSIITVENAFSETTNGKTIAIFGNETLVTSVDYGAHTTQISTEFEAGETASMYVATVVAEDDRQQTAEFGSDIFMRSVFLGGAVHLGTSYGTVHATSTTSAIKLVQTADTATGLAANMTLALPGNIRRKISTNTQDGGAGPSYTVTYTLAAGHELTATELAAVLSGTGYVRTHTKAEMSIFGKAGVANGIATYLTVGGTTTEDLKYSFTTNQTLKQFKDYINANTSYNVSIPDGVNGDLITMKSFDFNNASGNYLVDVTYDEAVSPTTKGRFLRDAAAYVDAAAQAFDKVTVARWTSEPAVPARTGTVDVPGSTTTALTVTGGGMGINDYKGMWVTINSETKYITSNTATVLNLHSALSAAPANTDAFSIYNYGNGGTIPATTGGVYTEYLDSPVYLSGGTRGTSANTDFEDGFAALILQRHNHIVPLIDQNLANEGNGSTATWASVASYLVQHVADARSGGRNECGGYIGFTGTKSEILTKLAFFNDQDIQMTAQAIETLDATGELTVRPNWGLAVAAAGMRAGAAEVGEPLTFKYFRTASLSQDSSWNPANITDANKMIEKGLLFGEETDQGFRFVRDMTTYVKDDNIAFMEGSTRDAVRYIAYDFRKALEDKFTGRKGTPVTIADIKVYATGRLKLYKDQNIIIPSYDENNILVPNGYRNLTVTYSDGVATLRVEIYPVTGITFELIDITLQPVKLAV